MIDPRTYFRENDLFDLERLKAHAEHHGVWLITSEKFPGVVMLHYKDEVQWDNTWSSFSRMCRGLVVDLNNQKILAYPFDKFFNLGQVAETAYSNLAELGKFETFEKLDGSMIVTFIDPNTNQLVFSTKGSLNSEHGQYACELPLARSELVRMYAEQGTLIFELIAKPFQIVVDYAKKGYDEGLYLIGYRHWYSGKLVSTEELAGIAKHIGVPMFKTYSFNSLDALIEHAKDLPVLEEGYVLRFQNGLLVKVKGEAYLRAHRFISRLSDANLLEAVAEGVDKELLEIAPEEYRTDIEEKVAYFKRRIIELTNECYEEFTRAPKDSRKEFALWVQREVDSPLRGFLFTIMDQKPLDRKKLCNLIATQDRVSVATRI